ncbi:MAG TPA: hypothetical protein VM165_03365 [Planctomycetaceae bacterium]|nr:hypothetical protein [Planctomycetaceae bacterium]
MTGLLAGLAAGAWAFDDAPQAGLQGILPADIPAELSADAFAPLGETWAEWNATAVAAVEAVYKAEGDVAAQRAALAKLKAKLGVINKALGDNQYAMISEPLISLRGPLARRIAIAEALLDTLEADPQAERGPQLKSKADAVTAALGSLKRDLATIEGGSAWLPYVKADALEAALKASPEGDATVAALQVTQAQIAKRDALTDAAQKTFLSRNSFTKLHAAAGELLAVASRPAGPLDVVKLRPELTKLVAALEDYESTGSSVAAAQAREALKSVDEIAGSGRLMAVIAEHYLNDNVRIAASERFLSRLLSDARVEQGQVRDFVLGANVGGWQTTATNVGVDLKPSNDRLRFDLVLNGTVQSNTAGATSQATIYTSGYHTFRSAKEITFDGYTFTTGPATIAVNANNTTTGASTRMSGVPLFGRMAQRIAMQEAGNRRPQAEAIAASRVSDRVVPKFNEEVNRAFANATRDIETELAAGLKAARIYPDRQHYASTNDRAVISTRLAQNGKLGGNVADAKLLEPRNGAAVVMHESVINNSIDEIGFAGKTMSEEELRHHLEQFLSTALSREFKFRAPEEAAQTTPAKSDDEAAEDDAAKGPAKLVFAKDDPIRVQFGDGVLLLVIRAGLEREGQDPIPEHEISVPLHFEVAGDQLKIVRDSLKIVPVEGGFSPVQQKVMNTRISAALPERTVSGKFKLQGPSREVDARVTGITLVDGWIAVAVE